MRFSKVILSGVLLVVISLISGCAGYQSFKRGGELVSAKQWEESLASYRQASEAEPDNLEYRAALRRVTDQAISALLDDAANLRGSQPDEARGIYKRVLAIAPRNDAALAGLRTLESNERRAALYADAVRAHKAGRDQDARQKLKKLLDEAPDYAQASQLLRAMDAKAGRPRTAPALDMSFQKPVTLEFRDASLRSVLDMLARTTGLNFIFDRDLRQDSKVTVFVRNVKLDEALDQICAANGLGQRIVNHNTLLIYPSQPQKIKEYQDQVVHSFFLANADAKQMTALFKTVLKAKDIFLDEKRNLVVMRDTPEVIAMASKLVAAHDQPEPEVMLEVEILEVKHTTLNDLGIKFPDQVAFGIASPISITGARSANGDSINVIGLDKALILNLKRQVGNTNLLANPRIRVRNKEKAKIHIGDRLPVVTSTISAVGGFNSESVTYLDVGIKLEVEPTIQMDEVVIKAGLEVSSLVDTIKTNNGSTVYQVGTRNAATTLTLHDGETQVLAGLLQKNERGTSSRLPGLGDVPVLGRLFSSNATGGDKTEVLLSITPHILRNLERPADDLVEFDAGTEAGRQGSGGQIGMPIPFVPQHLTVTPANQVGGAVPPPLSPPSRGQPAAANVPVSAAPTQPATVAPAATGSNPVADFSTPPGAGSPR